MSRLADSSCRFWKLTDSLVKSTWLTHILLLSCLTSQPARMSVPLLFSRWIQKTHSVMPGPSPCLITNSIFRLASEVLAPFFSPLSCRKPTLPRFRGLQSIHLGPHLYHAATDQSRFPPARLSRSPFSHSFLPFLLRLVLLRLLDPRHPLSEFVACTHFVNEFVSSRLPFFFRRRASPPIFSNKRVPPSLPGSCACKTVSCTVSQHPQVCDCPGHLQTISKAAISLHSMSHWWPDRPICDIAWPLWCGSSQFMHFRRSLSFFPAHLLQKAWWVSVAFHLHPAVHRVFAFSPCTKTVHEFFVCPRLRGGPSSPMSWIMHTFFWTVANRVTQHHLMHPNALLGLTFSMHHRIHRFSPFVYHFSQQLQFMYHVEEFRSCHGVLYCPSFRASCLFVDVRGHRTFKKLDKKKNFKCERTSVRPAAVHASKTGWNRIGSELLCSWCERSSRGTIGWWSCCARFCFWCEEERRTDRSGDTILRRIINAIPHNTQQTPLKEDLEPMPIKGECLRIALKSKKLVLASSDDIRDCFHVLFLTHTGRHRMVFFETGTVWFECCQVVRVPQWCTAGSWRKPVGIFLIKHGWHPVMPKGWI